MTTTDSRNGSPPGFIERFLALESASGMVLLAAALLALAWANSPARDVYQRLWQVTLGGPFAALGFEHDLRFWINDGLMAVFFLLVGLEIRREIQHGVLSDVRRAALPVVAALGGMLFPALIFLALNIGRPTVRGWGVPTATDIAFAVGVLTLLGNRVPRSLRVLLLALAVIDDLGAIVVIAIFYTSGVAPAGLAVAGAGVAAVLGLQRLRVSSPWAYVPLGVVTWAGTHAAGVHPAISGVVLGLLTPVHVNAHGAAASPADRIERALQRPVTFGVMPLFALANAGVSLGDVTLNADRGAALLGAAVGLLLGKPLGIVAVCRLATGLGLAAPPPGVTWRHMLVLGLIAGVGFTMAIFIAQLAFADGSTLEACKLGILAGSAAAAGVGLLVGWRILPAAPPVDR